MIERHFNEIDLRSMLEKAIDYSEDKVEGRYLIKSKYKGKNWEIIVEPEVDEKLLVVVTAYAIED